MRPFAPRWEGRHEPAATGSGSALEPGQGSGGQPPCPGPGYAYGYGPRPPRPRRRHPLRGALIALGLFVVFGIVVRIATGSHASDSAASSGTLASGGPASTPPPGKLGSSFDVKDGSENTYQVTLAKVIDPATGANQVSSPDTALVLFLLLVMRRASHENRVASARRGTTR